MQRRKFIKLAGLGVLVGLGAAATYTLLAPFESIIFSVLKRDLKNLNIAENDMRSYAHDAALHNPYHFSIAKIKMISLFSQLENIGIKGRPFYNKYKQYRSDMVGNFLLSTDFFWNKLSEKDEIKYSGRIFTPYNYPCGNPFSNRYYP